VRDATGQGAQRFHLLGLPQLGFEPRAFRHVAGNALDLTRGPRPGEALGTDLKRAPLARLGDNGHGEHHGRESGVGPCQHVLEQL
jgi:hypothetical protein